MAQFIKIGDNFINLDHVQGVETSKDGTVRVYLAPNVSFGPKDLTARGDEAQAVIAAVSSQASTTPAASATSKAQAAPAAAK